MEINIKESLELRTELSKAIQVMAASAVIEVYGLNAEKYRDYADLEECPTGLDIQLQDNHGFTENYYITWEQLEDAGF